jgi:hypothetical protein
MSVLQDLKGGILFRCYFPGQALLSIVDALDALALDILPASSRHLEPTGEGVHFWTIREVFPPCFSC